jgi:hypothetical protein
MMEGMGYDDYEVYDGWLEGEGTPQVKFKVFTHYTKYLFHTMF